MPRFRNKATGVIVTTSAETAESLGSAWVPVDTEPAREAADKKPAPRRRTKKSE